MKTERKIVVAVSGHGKIVAGTVRGLVLRKIGVSTARYGRAKEQNLSGSVLILGKVEDGMCAWTVTEDVGLLTMSGKRGLNASSGGFLGYKNKEA